MTPADLHNIGEDGRRFRIFLGSLLCCFALGFTALVTVTARLPKDDLARDLNAKPDALKDAGIKSVTALGDALAPSTIAAAVYAGHNYARLLGEAPSDAVPFEREFPG